MHLLPAALPVTTNACYQLGNTAAPGIGPHLSETVPCATSCLVLCVVTSRSSHAPLIFCSCISKLQAHPRKAPFSTAADPPGAVPPASAAPGLVQCSPGVRHPHDTTYPGAARAQSARWAEPGAGAVSGSAPAGDRLQLLTAVIQVPGVQHLNANMQAAGDLSASLTTGGRRLRGTQCQASPCRVQGQTASFLQQTYCHESKPGGMPAGVRHLFDGSVQWQSYTSHRLT